MRISDWSSDVCSSDLLVTGEVAAGLFRAVQLGVTRLNRVGDMDERSGSVCLHRLAAWISGSPLVDHAAARSGCATYIWSGVQPPSAACGRTAFEKPRSRQVPARASGHDAQAWG